MQNPEPDPKTASAERQPLIVPVKFGSTNSLSSSQMQGLTALVQLFARGVSFRLGAWLGTAVRVSLVSAERILFSEFLDTIGAHDSYVASLKMEPVNSSCLAYLDFSLIDPTIDLLLGGSGSASLSREPSDITDIEVSILDSVMHEICDELSNAWKSLSIEVHHQQRLLSSHHGQAMPVRDSALSLSFEVLIGHAQGSLRFLFSGLATDTLLRAITTENTKRTPSPALKQKLQERALRFRYGASLQLPIVSISAHALNTLEPGSVLPLRVSTDTPAVFMVAGKTMFHAQPVATGLRRGAYLTQTAFTLQAAAEKTELGPG
jgi:flagellar motor switch protein FliM